MIYILEDDKNIRELISYALRQSNFENKSFEEYQVFNEALNTQLPSIIILDLMLPQIDGIEILKRLKSNQKTQNISILIISAKSSEFDKVLGLDLGADDYMTKPFSIMELIARVKVILKRISKNFSDIQFNDLFFNENKKEFSILDSRIEFTKKEYQILSYLIKYPNHVFSRDELMEKVWGYDVVIESRSLDMHIKEIRKKLGDYSKCIETVRGFGYKFVF